MNPTSLLDGPPQFILLATVVAVVIYCQNWAVPK